MILRVNTYITCEIRLKTQNRSNLLKIGQTRSKLVKLDKTGPISQVWPKLKKIADSLSRVPRP
jgi:hypothetical protein